MKHRNILFIALVFIFVGLILTFAGFALSGFNLFNQNAENSKMVEKKYQSEISIHRIQILVENADIEVTPSNDGKTRISYTESPNYPYEIYETNGLLQITQKRPWYKHIGFFMHDFQKSQIRLQIPEELTGYLKMTTINGDYQLNRLKILGELEAETINGSFDITEISAGNIDLQSCNGNISLKESTSKGEVSLKTVNGNIKFTHLLAKSDLDFQTVSGDIHGSINGKASDYHIDSEIVVGESNLPNNATGGEKELEVECVTGKVNITFSQE